MEKNNLNSTAVIKVIGVGGAGGNAINTMIRSGLSGVEFIAANTDLQALEANLAPLKIQLGRELTKGLGAGANPDVGRDAALEDRSIIQEILSGADMVFVTAGMGGGTGTGAAPIIAQVARELGALTVGVVTKPFAFEGKRRRGFGEAGIQNLRAAVDTLITIPNQRLLSIAPPTMSMLDGFKLADEVLLNAVKGISDIIGIRGEKNIDFADVRTTMSEMGMALMGTGIATGPNRAQEAARAAISSPLLEDIDIEGATGILINIAGSASLTMLEVHEAATLIQEAAHEDANIIFGFVIDDELNESIRVTVIATGFDKASIVMPDSFSSSQQAPHNQNGYPSYDHQVRPQGLNSPQYPPRMNAPSGYDSRGMGAQQAAPKRPNGEYKSPNYSSEVSYMEQSKEYMRRTGATSTAPFPKNIHRDPVVTPDSQAKANGNTEYESLTQWTLDLAKDKSQGGVERPLNGAVIGKEKEPSVPPSEVNEAEAAIQIAKELQSIPIEDSFETPTYLRRKDDTHLKNI